MPDTIISTSRVYASGVRAFDDLGNLTVIAGVSLFGQASDFVRFSSYTASFVNYGSVGAIADTGGVVNVNGAPQDLLSIDNYGSIVAQGAASALYLLDGRLSIINTGTLSSTRGLALDLRGDQTSVVNDGLISGATGAILLRSAFSNRVATVQNNGEIRGAITASDTVMATDMLTISNSAHGAITGDVTLGGGGDSIRNQGVITGAVNLGAGGNLLDNRGSIFGALTFGGGADALINTGEIHGNITLGDGANTITSPGVIYGTLTTGAGNDTIDLTLGTVTGAIVAGGGNDTITGGDGREVIYADDPRSTDTGGGADIVNANGGDDVIYGGYGADIVYGGYGDDVLNGGYGTDQLYGNQGDDVLYGNQDNDWMHGGQGNDILYGGQGDDTLNGGVGDDVLYGNLGNDTFVFTGQGFGHDTIADFARSGGGGDVIQFGAGIFTGFADLQAHATAVSGGTLIVDAAGDTLFLVGLAPGALTADMFVVG